MKRILAFWLCLMLILLPLWAFAESAIDTTAVVTQMVIWVLCGVLTALGAVATWAVKTYIIPWLKDVAVPWLEQHSLLEATQTAVNYAEQALGRYTGEQKRQMALKYLKSLGWNVDSEEVLAALGAKWLELDLKQITAGVKETVGTGKSE